MFPAVDHAMLAAQAAPTSTASAPASPTAAPAIAAPASVVASGTVSQPAPIAAPFTPVAVPVSAHAPPSSLSTRTNASASTEAVVARLVTILKDGSEGQVYRISGATTDIGRTEGNILLADDPYLSPRHARISVHDGRLYLRDLGSVNGIFYKIREPTILSNHDVVLLGQQVLRIDILSEHETSFGPVSHYGVLLFGTPEQPRIARLVQLTTEGIPRDVHHLFREETVVGRESGDIVFTDDAFLSRRHATFRIDRVNRRVIVSDLGSSNGTFVRFRGERELQNGDVFRVGHHLFRIDLPAHASTGGAAHR
jgi:pSer/pThr/pTyr-binding forkhead associated (FHA) protein